MNWKDERNSCNISLQRAAPLLRSVLKKKEKRKKSSLFKKNAFSVDLVSLLPALETREWLLFIWPKWSHYPGVGESGSWLTPMFPLRSCVALCIDSAVLSNEQDYFWPCDGIFVKVSMLWPVFWTEIAHMEIFLSCLPRCELDTSYLKCVHLSARSLGNRQEELELHV